jgi:hypothetical protein
MDEPSPIPEILHATWPEGPFRTCVACGGDLAEEDRLYQIQKVWRHGEVVLEMAICAECAVRTAREFSEESLRRLGEYFEERYRPGLGLDRCHFCGGERTPDSEFEIGAACRGPFLLRPPVVVCSACNEAAQEHLSEKTRDAWGRFVDTNLPGVPESMEPDPVPFGF